MILLLYDMRLDDDIEYLTIKKIFY